MGTHTLAKAARDFPGGGIAGAVTVFEELIPIKLPNFYDQIDLVLGVSRGSASDGLNI